MTLSTFLLILLLWQVFENFRLQARLSDVEYNVSVIQSVESVQGFVTVLDALLEESVIVPHREYENTVEGRASVINEILEKTMPLALTRYTRTRTDNI